MIVSKNSKIYVAGHTGMVGSSICRALENGGYNQIITKSFDELDLRQQSKVNEFYNEYKPDVVIDAAARVGGILANNEYPYQFLMENLQIQNNLIDGAYKIGCSKFIFLGSSCIYPKLAPQPLKEEYLLTDSLEKTNEWYAIAKIAGVKACQSIRKQFKLDYVSLMPTNLYGPNDNFDLKTSHVLPAMIRKFHDAKVDNQSTVTLWGTGLPMREFLHVDDLANAILFALENTLKDHLYNVGTGSDLKIKDLAKIIQKEVGHKGKVVWDKSKPDGTPRKLLDISKIKNIGWIPKITLHDGINKTYKWFLNNQHREVKFK